MALTSPRFKSSRRLVAASTDAPPLRKGARGRGVHLIQFALIDLGHAMPHTTSKRTSPDGIYGDETVKAVKAFQQARGLTVDGVVGRNTMGALEAAFPRPGHRTRLHFRSLSLTTIPFEQTLRNAQTVYGQYGIDIVFGSGESLFLSPAQTALFDRIDQTCLWTITTGEYDQLHRLGTPCPANEIKVYYVNRLRHGDRGCGGHAPRRPAVTVAHSGGPWSTAHEIGHVLLTEGFNQDHHRSPRNLMFTQTWNRNAVMLLSLPQVQQMRRHACCIAV